MVCILISCTNTPGVAGIFSSERSQDRKPLRVPPTLLHQCLVRTLMTSLPSTSGLSHMTPLTRGSWASPPTPQAPEDFLFQLLIPALPQVEGMMVPSPSQAEVCTPMIGLGFLLIGSRAGSPDKLLHFPRTSSVLLCLMEQSTPPVLIRLPQIWAEARQRRGGWKARVQHLPPWTGTVLNMERKLIPAAPCNLSVLWP